MPSLSDAYDSSVAASAFVVRGTAGAKPDSSHEGVV